jgi:hypothetical protein
MSGALSPPVGQRSVPDYNAKGKRQLDGAGRGYLAKAQRTDPDQNRKKGKGKSSSANPLRRSLTGEAVRVPGQMEGVAEPM